MMRRDHANQEVSFPEDRLVFLVREHNTSFRGNFLWALGLTDLSGKCLNQATV